MSFLADEMWSKIMELGVATNRLRSIDLCSLAITCRRHCRISGDDTLWAILLASDFPDDTSSFSPATPLKSLYQTMFARSKAQRVTERRCAIMSTESKVCVCKKRLEELECQWQKEGERMKAALEELCTLERVRQAYVALNVWQPVVVRDSQSQMVEQCTVPIAARLSDLKMEVNLCKQQIATYKKAYTEQKQKLRKSEEALSSLTYDPLEAYHLVVSDNYCGTKRLKLKSWSSRLSGKDVKAQEDYI